MFLLLEDKNISSRERTCWRRVELRGRSTSGVFFFNVAGLFKAIEIWKAAGNKWSNHWEVLKSALLRATPPQLISRRSCMLGVPQQHGGRSPLLFFSPTRVMKRQLWMQCYIYEKGWKFPAKGCMPECGLLHRESLSHSSPILPPCPSDTTPESHLENRWACFSELCVTEQPLVQTWKHSPCVYSGAARRHGLKGVKKDLSVV